MKRLAAICTLTMLTAAAPASADIVFQNNNDNGFFVPFNSSSPAGIRYGDGGWLSGFQPETYTLVEITLGLAVYNSPTAGSTDITFTFNDGDPSGLVFGPGSTLYSTTITDVFLPATEVEGVETLYLTIPLPGVETAGGFNNIGFSIGVENFDYDGSFGFQASSAVGQSVGFYTNNASFYNGSSWSLFSFSGDPTFGVANFVATIQTPEPATLGLLALGAMFAARRRR